MEGNKILETKGEGNPYPENEALSFVKVAIDQRTKLIRGFFRVLPRGFDLQLGPRTSSQHHQPHNTFAVNGFAVFLHHNFRLEPTRQLHKLGRRPGMNAQLVLNFADFARDVFFHNDS